MLILFVRSQNFGRVVYAIYAAFCVHYCSLVKQAQPLFATPGTQTLTAQASPGIASTSSTTNNNQELITGLPSPHFDGPQNGAVASARTGTSARPSSQSAQSRVTGYTQRNPLLALVSRSAYAAQSAVLTCKHWCSCLTLVLATCYSTFQCIRVALILTIQPRRTSPSYIFILNTGQTSADCSSILHMPMAIHSTVHPYTLQSAITVTIGHQVFNDLVLL